MARIDDDGVPNGDRNAIPLLAVLGESGTKKLLAGAAPNKDHKRTSLGAINTRLFGPEFPRSFPLLEARQWTPGWIVRRSGGSGYKRVITSRATILRQPMDFEAEAKNRRFDFLLGYTIALDESRPVWKDGDFFGKTSGKRK
jgi:hypothetical protein